MRAEVTGNEAHPLSASQAGKVSHRLPAVRCSVAGEVDRHDVVVGGELAGEGVEQTCIEPGGVEQDDVVVPWPHSSPVRARPSRRMANGRSPVIGRSCDTSGCPWPEARAASGEDL